MIILQKSLTGPRKAVPTGFSWTTFFFGIFPALFRGDAKNAAFMFFSALFTLGLSWLVWPFIYNDVYISGLKAAGWTEAENETGTDGRNNQKSDIPVYHDIAEPPSGYKNNPRLDILLPEPEPQTKPDKVEPEIPPAPVARNPIGVATSFGRRAT
ncbi:hypothetical protein ACFOWX_06915 [Sphingorhabdus arenilitoris]|uniref:Superinfection immunity protein n=1 Tax=Sphingorhabdus arenilitoris TaxID=1490041 RepID=A0ABV8RFE3_9SPHN